MTLLRKDAIMEKMSQEKKWKEWAEKLKKEYPDLTDQDLKFEQGREEETLIRLQDKLKKTKEEITNWLHIMG